MSKFRIGDEVTLKANYKEWESMDGPLAGTYPVFGEVYTVCLITNGFGTYFITLSELHPEDEFEDTAFDKVVSDTVLLEELESVPEPYTQ